MSKSPDAPEGVAPKPRKLPRKPASSLAEKWTRVDGIDVFYRESVDHPVGAPVIMHVHGFGMSGHYLLPTAERLQSEFHTLVPDLPGFGRSGKSRDMLEVRHLAHAAARFLDDRGIEKVSLVGNSMGCPVIVEFAHAFPDRLERAVLVSPAGGLHNQPLSRAVGQLAKDGGREPRKMIAVSVPDYLRFGIHSTFRMFNQLTQYPSLDRLLELAVPTLVVIGDRDPLIPGPQRVHEVAALTDNAVLLVKLEGAAHAINFSHPGELAHLIRLFMEDKPIVDDPDSPGTARVVELHRGVHHPKPKSASG